MTSLEKVPFSWKEIFFMLVYTVVVVVLVWWWFGSMSLSAL